MTKEEKVPEKDVNGVKEDARTLAAKKINEFLDSLKKGAAELYRKIDEGIQLTVQDKKLLHEFNQAGLLKRIQTKLVEVRASKIIIDNRLEERESLILKLKGQLEKVKDETKKVKLEAKIELETDAYKQLLIYRELLERQEELLKDAAHDLKIKVEVEPLLPIDEEVEGLLEEARASIKTSDVLAGLAEKEEAKAKAIKETAQESLEEE